MCNCFIAPLIFLHLVKSFILVMRKDNASFSAMKGLFSAQRPEIDISWFVTSTTIFVDAVHSAVLIASSWTIRWSDFITDR